jgi:hypothetical protein
MSFIKNKIFKSNKGQSVFEFIIFAPFLVFMYTIFYTAGNSINGSINQQKALRGYFYHILKGNSYITSHSDIKKFRDNGVSIVGFMGLGWREHDKNERDSFAPCFKFSSILKNNSTEECDDSKREEEGMSRFVRVFTYYGVCGPTFFPASVVESPDRESSLIMQEKQSLLPACTLSH